MITGFPFSLTGFSCHCISLKALVKTPFTPPLLARQPLPRPPEQASRLRPRPPRPRRPRPRRRPRRRRSRRHRQAWRSQCRQSRLKVKNVSCVHDRHKEYRGGLRTTHTRHATHAARHTAAHAAAAHAAKLREVVCGCLVLLVLVDPLVKVGLEEVDLLGVLEQARPVLVAELLLDQLELDGAGGVVDLAGGLVDLGVEVEDDLVGALQGLGEALEGDAGGLEGDLGLGRVGVGDDNGQVDKVLLGVVLGGALGPEDCGRVIVSMSEFNYESRFKGQCAIANGIGWERGTSGGDVVCFFVTPFRAQQPPGDTGDRMRMSQGISMENSLPSGVYVSADMVKNGEKEGEREAYGRAR